MRSTPTPYDVFRTANVSRLPLPEMAITTPSKTWIRSFSPLDDADVDTDPLPGLECRHLPRLFLFDSVNDVHLRFPSI